MSEVRSENEETNSTETCSKSKSKVPEGPVSSWTREQFVDWLEGIGASYSGTKECLIKKILKFQNIPVVWRKSETEQKETASF